MSDQNESDQEYNNMSPKSGKDDKTTNTGPSAVSTEAVEEDLNGNKFSARWSKEKSFSFFTEIDSVDSNLDSINSVLDFIEQRTDNIRAQLLELLTSSREIRQSIIEENGQSLSNEENKKNKDGMDMS